jgi:hypothetical protein
VLALHTLHFADEIIGATTSTTPSRASAPGDREVEMAGRLVECAARATSIPSATRTSTARPCST